MQPSSGDVFGDRRKALEDSFFRERDQQLLKNLVKAGVRADTLAALTLIPLVEVAWADGAVSADEREAVLKAAAENGVKQGSASYELLARWLAERPDVRVIASWKEYVHALA